jgi:aminoacyl tRNA synthase complex-interacting multifunctional protein 1
MPSPSSHLILRLGRHSNATRLGFGKQTQREARIIHLQLGKRFSTVCRRKPYNFNSTQSRRFTATQLQYSPKMSAIDSKTAEFLASKSKLSSAPSSDTAKTSASLWPSIKYTPEDETEITKWSSELPKGDAIVAQLNDQLSTRTTILGSKPSVADLVAYVHIAPLVKDWDDEKRTGHNGFHHVVRFINFVQNAAPEQYGLSLADDEKIKIDLDKVLYVPPPVDLKAERERKKKEKEAAATVTAAGAGAGSVGPVEAAKEQIKEKAKEVKEKVKDAAAAAGGQPSKKKEKKEKAPKQPPAPKDKPLSPCLIDLRVGHILKAVQHPNADSLYVSTIAVGDAPGTDNTSEYEGQIVRTVCSGLNGLIPLEEMQGRKIVAVCNLKPVTMRGVKSCAMVLAASPREEGDGHKGPVELVNPPADAKAGDRIYFEGWEGDPEAVLNPKKKIWEALQPGFTTTDDLEVGFDVAAVEQLKESGKTGIAKLRTAASLCSVKSLKGATVR